MVLRRLATPAVIGALALVPAGCTRDAHAEPGAVPILVYHHIGDPPPGERAPSLYVTRQRFAAHLDALRRAGFRAVTLDQVWAAWHHGATLPRHPVVLSFDDGYAEQDTIARPALARRHWPGVLNLTLNRLNLRGGLSTGAIGRLRGAGWEIDDHSTTHPHLTMVGPARLRTEVAGSRAAFRRLLDLTPRFFCYPYGRADATVRNVVRAAGFTAATTIRPGLATPRQDPFALSRIVVRGTMPPADLVGLARG